MKQVALSRNVQVPKWGPEVKALSDHWPVSIDLKCPRPTKCQPQMTKPKYKFDIIKPSVSSPSARN